MELIKKTSLQKIGADISETLNWKLQELQSNNLPVEEGIADYIFLGMSNIDKEIEQLTNYQNQIKDKIKELKDNKELTSENIATWLQEEQGVDKIKGISVSSITINKGKDSKSKTVIKKEFVTHLTNEQIQALLIEQGLGHYKEVQSTETTKSTNDKIRINKRK